MSGTLEGGRRAAATNKRKYGDDFYANIGRKGGQVSKGGGFAANKALARRAGRLGGLKSKRRKNLDNAFNTAITDDDKRLGIVTK